MSHICPLGLCRTEEDCPNAPCVECMRRLGEHILEEINVIQRQALVAKAKGDYTPMSTLQELLKSMGSALTIQEMTQAASLTAPPNTPSTASSMNDFRVRA